jgi:hypothetical protein
MTAALIDLMLIAESKSECSALAALMIAPREVLEYANLRGWEPAVNAAAKKFWNGLDKPAIMQADLDQQVRLAFNSSVKTGFPWLHFFPYDNAADTGRKAIDGCRALRAARIGLNYIQANKLISKEFSKVPEVWND